MPTGIYERKRRPMADRFWEKVDKSGECWLWTRACDPEGYGRFNCGPGQGTQLAPRVAYELTFGPIPEGLDVLHTCDNPPCVRPVHLFLGTQAVNMADMVAKDRRNDAHGERAATAKLTSSQVQAIRAHHAKGGISFAQLGREHGIAAPTVAKLIRGITWRRIA